MIVLGIDPGKVTGWALVKTEDKKMSPMNFGHSRDQTALELQPQIEKAEIVVIESFLVRPKNARRGAFDYDDMVAPRVIGAVTTLATLLGKQVVMQPASIKPVGYGFSNTKYVKGKKNMHQWDALAHACYWLVKNGHAYPVKRN